MKTRIQRLAVWGAAAALLTAGAALPLTGASAEDTRTEAQLAAAATAAREKIFGADWANPDNVQVKWVAITTYIANFGGRIVLLDSTIMDNLQGSNQTPYISLDEVIDAKPEAILQNHTHLDQMRHASRIAAITGAQLVTTAGGCLFAKRDAIQRGFKESAVNCNYVRDSSGRVFTGLDTYVSPFSGEPLVTPFGTVGKPESPIPGLDITVVNIKHSQIRPYPDDLTYPYVGADPSPLVDDTPSPEQLADFGLTQDFDNGNLLFMVGYKGFNVVHHGSSGSLNPIEPGQAEIRQGLRALSLKERPDVELGGIQELTYTNGFVEARRYAEEIGAKLYIPLHHGNWLPPITAEARSYYDGWLAEMQRTTASVFPKLCFVVEENMATAFTFNVKKWAGDKTGPFEAVGGPGCYTGSG